MAGRQHLHKLDTLLLLLLGYCAGLLSVTYRERVESCGLRMVLKLSAVSACTTAVSRMVPLYDCLYE